MIVVGRPRHGINAVPRLMGVRDAPLVQQLVLELHRVLHVLYAINGARDLYRLVDICA